jgi:hypothetical protein
MTYKTTEIMTACKMIDAKAADLSYLADALRIAGNDSLAKRLQSMSDAIYQLTDDVRCFAGSEVEEAYQESMRNIGRTLSILVEGLNK